MECDLVLAAKSAVLHGAFRLGRPPPRYRPTNNVVDCRYTQASPILRLHQEICDFTHLMRPTIDEVKDRSRVEEDLKAVVVRAHVSVAVIS